MTEKTTLPALGSTAVLGAELKPEDYDLPPYPEGEVVGPCVCGSWPGGKCFRCKVVPNGQGQG